MDIFNQNDFMPKRLIFLLIDRPPSVGFVQFPTEGGLFIESVRVDLQLDQKISKRRFFQDIINSFQGATQLGLKLPQFFSFQKILTNTVARSVQILGQYGPQQAG